MSSSFPSNRSTEKTVKIKKKKVIQFFVGSLVISDIIENFDTDDHVPSVLQNGKNVIAFDLPKNLFIQEVLKTGMSRDFHRYKV